MSLRCLDPTRDCVVVALVRACLHHLMPLPASWGLGHGGQATISQQDCLVGGEEGVEARWDETEPTKVPKC